MAIPNEIFDLKKPRTIGKILRAKQCGRIEELILPESQSVMTVRAVDLGDARIRVLNDYIPILAHNYVSYVGQPVVAVFGQREEEVEAYMDGIKIKMAEVPPHDEKFELKSDEEELIGPILQALQSSNPNAHIAEPHSKPFVFSYGDISKYFNIPKRDKDEITQNESAQESLFGSTPDAEMEGKAPGEGAKSDEAPKDNLSSAADGDIEAFSLNSDTNSTSLASAPISVRTDSAERKRNPESKPGSTGDASAAEGDAGNPRPGNPGTNPDSLIDATSAKDPRDAWLSAGAASSTAPEGSAAGKAETKSSPEMSDPSEPSGNSFEDDTSSDTGSSEQKHHAEKFRVIETEFEVESISNSIMGATKFYANTADDIIYISCPSQWPLHVRDSVASVLKMPRSRVMIETQDFHTHYDHMLIQPAIYATLTAFAASRLGGLVELQINLTSWRPRTKYRFQTALDKKGNPAAFRARADIDFGAFPLFVEEACVNIMAGLIPNYPVEAFQININALRSNTPPANFFGDLGFYPSLTATENHFNHLVHETGTSPADWKIQNLQKTFPARSTVILSTSPEGMRQNIAECVEDSEFGRKYAAYSQFSTPEAHRKAILPYYRGIGLSAGQGITGFSNKFHYVSQYSVTLTHTGKEISVAIGFNLTRYLKKCYRSIIQKYFDINTDKINFEDINSPVTPDSGPNTLSRATGMVIFLLENACQALKEKIERGSPYPIVETSFKTGFESADYFVSCCSGSVCVDVHMDTVHLRPVVDGVYARIKTGKVYDITGFQDALKHMISRTISEACPTIENAASIDLRVRSNPQIFSGFSIYMVQGLTISALCSALGQAVNGYIRKIPITEEDLFNIMMRRDEK